MLRSAMHRQAVIPCLLEINARHAALSMAAIGTHDTIITLILTGSFAPINILIIDNNLCCCSVIFVWRSLVTPQDLHGGGDRGGEASPKLLLAAAVVTGNRVAAACEPVRQIRPHSPPEKHLHAQ
jgi:hypothetical protein